MTTNGIDTTEFTATQLRLWSVLKDGFPRTQQELLAAMEDDQAEFRTVAVHLSVMRKRLRKQEYTIAADMQSVDGKKVVYYRLVRFCTNFL